ncbi:hypothetical protein KGP36_06920 [Patescibacteria group bacterium]|nr:hypothetical protein [Patescibacteria group bacterium]
MEAFKEAFYDFLSHVRIVSKEKVPGAGEIASPILPLYNAQQRLLDEIFEGLALDIHYFVCLKARQLGCSTITRALMVFWALVHPGVRMALVYDTDANKEDARLEIQQFLINLPPRFAVEVTDDNRYAMQFKNGSRISFFVAGAKKSKATGGLGRSRGINCVGATEMCSWADEEGLQAFERSLAETHPDRLYIWESTARGYNLFWRIWEKAKEDELTKRAIFLGWWAKELYAYARGTTLFEKYGKDQPTDREQERITEVWKRYGYKIKPEQLAWYRHQSNPNQNEEGEYISDSEADILAQELPWTEDEAFILSGSTFFDNDSITNAMAAAVNERYKAYRFYFSDTFAATVVKQTQTEKNCMLKVWEEPNPDGVYIVSADPAYGHSEDSNGYAIQVLRCYADGIDQVAEFRNVVMYPHQFAWVIACLCGWYGNVRMVVELNGPGEAVWNEFRHLKEMLANGYVHDQCAETGLANVLSNIRNYMFGRSDTFAGPSALQWKDISILETLPTPSGWVKVGDVEVGDTLFGPDGKPCTVIGMSETFRDNKCYRITFDSGKPIIVGEGHLWSVATKFPKRKLEGECILTTRELVPGKHFIQVGAPLELPDADLPIDPYTLGMWLGNGTSINAQFSHHCDDIEEVSSHIEAAGFSLGNVSSDRPDGNGRRRTINGLRPLLSENNLLGNKHIPIQYLRASKAQRLALLQGLMDSDGTVQREKRGNATGCQCSFTSSNPVLAEGFAELLTTLGIKPKRTMRTRTIRYKGEYRTYEGASQFYFQGNPQMPPFRLKRKAERVIAPNKPKDANTKFHRIVSIEEVESVPTKCLAVDNESHLFLAGKGMVPTHNTTQDLKRNAMERYRDFFQMRMLNLRSTRLITEMKSIIREGDEIRGEGTTDDDLVIAMAIGIRCWEDFERKMMNAQKRTRAYENRKRSFSFEEQCAIFSSNLLENFFDLKKKKRNRLARETSRRRWH